MSCPHGNHLIDCDYCEEESRQWSEGYASSLTEISQLKAERDVLLAQLAAIAQPAANYTYASTQQTNCAGCGLLKHTPLRVDRMEGYVCLTCIDKKLESLLDSSIAAEPAIEGGA